MISLRTGSVSIKRIIKGGRAGFICCIKGTFRGVAINEINCCAALRTPENADETMSLTLVTVPSFAEPPLD
jgi:hypothetical protein